jgi:glycerol-1-phosphate dehydrogenase [NAD(P)+]
MDGYASNGAAMITGGMKVTYSAGLPMAILADTEVLASAPMEMIRAGFGDIVGKYSALNDWKLSHCVNGEYLCPYIYNTTYDQITTTLSLAEGLVKREEKSVGALMEALVVVGIMMSFAGSSRPASGSEHHLSHFFEITGILEGSEYFSHGIDVAYSTVITAGVREKLLAKPFPKTIYRPEPDFYASEMTRIYKEVGPGFMELQKKIGAYEKDRSEIYLAKEKEIRAIFAKMPTADEILAMLAKVEMNMDEFYALYGEEKIRDAVLYAKDIKDRYSALWVNYDYYGGEQ